jgi:hypothetical protein
MLHFLPSCAVIFHVVILILQNGFLMLQHEHVHTIQFTEQLIKGRIVETIFEMMFGNLEGCKLSRYGIEYTSPDLLKKDVRFANVELLEKLGNSPDFVFIKNNNITFVEVKYRHQFVDENVFNIVLPLIKNWDQAWLFLASNSGFYFDSVLEIYKNQGVIKPLSPDLIPLETQKEYLEILNKFGL